jgi:hypothetical protein
MRSHSEYDENPEAPVVELMASRPLDRSDGVPTSELEKALRAQKGLFLRPQPNDAPCKQVATF